MFVTFCLGSWSMMLSQVTTGAVSHIDYHGAIPCPAGPTPTEPAHFLPTPCPAGAAIPSAPNTTGFHETQAARLRAAEEALRDSVTREASLRGQVSALLTQLEQAEAQHTLGNGRTVPPAKPVAAVPLPDVPRERATLSTVPPPAVSPPSEPLPATPPPPSPSAQAGTAMAMAPYAEEITAEFPELKACLKNEETGLSVCVSPDIQFRTRWIVHLVPQDNPGKGWRFHHLIAQGLAKHPYVNLTSDMGEADAVIWLPTSTGQPPHSVPSHAKFLILDEGDGAGYVPKAQSMNYIAYFKRSWAKKNNGKVSVESGLGNQDSGGAAV